MYHTCIRKELYVLSNIFRINNRYYDLDPKNQSFLLTARELKELGIKHWYHCLEVKFPNLGVQDLDPFSPDLTQDDIAKILIECKHNVWYFMRCCARIPAKGAPQPFDLCLTRASHAAVWCFDHSIDFMLNQPRQTWKTTIALLLIVYAFVFEYKNVDIPFLHLKEPDTLRNAGMFKDYIEILPPYMNPWSTRAKPPGLKSLKYDEHGTSILITAAADSETKAMDKLRGQTTFMAFIDEWEYIPYIDFTIAGAAPAMKSARDIARQTGSRACIIYTSTPGNLETEMGRAAQKMINATPRFSEHMYDLTDEEVEAMFDNTSNDPNAVAIRRLYIEFTWQQLRKTEAWLRQQYNDAVASGKLAEYRRGILLQRFRGSKSELFRQEDIDYLKNNMKNPDHEIFMIKKFILYVYSHPIQTPDLNSDTPYFDISIPYMIGIDVSAGKDRDNTAICIVHPYTLQVVGELMSPHMSSLDLMRLITALARMLPKAIFCLESNGVGASIVDFVQESELEHRFYHDPKLDLTQNALTKENRRPSLKETSKQKCYIGTHVSAKVRETMITLLKRHVREYRSLMLSKYLATDITNLIVTKTGRVEACEGEHDDMAMAYLHVVYVLYYGYDLTRFGIDKSLCTYEKAHDIVDDYEKSIAADAIDNTLPYDCPTMYEEQLLSDILDSQRSKNDVDYYGYTQKQYNQNNRLQENPIATLSYQDIGFFREVNTFF